MHFFYYNLYIINVINYHMKDILYKHNEYKEFLKEYIKIHKKPGIMSELALAAGCDRTYFSQVLNLTSKIQLTPDHANGLAEYFQLKTAEEDYFLLLVHKERAVGEKYKAKLEIKIRELQKKSLNLTDNLKEKNIKISTESLLKYYSEWTYSAVHILTAIQSYQTIESISDKLSLRKEKTRIILSELVDMKLVVREGNKFVYTGDNLHAANSSVFNFQNHLNWRLKALETSHSADENTHYTSVFAINRSDWPRLRKKLLSFIDEQRKQIGASGSEEVYCFCADLFEVY